MRKIYEFSIKQMQRLIIVDDEKTIEDLCLRAFVANDNEYRFSRLNFNLLDKDSEELKKYFNCYTGLSELFFMKCFCCGETYSYQSINISTCEKCRNIDRAIVATKMIKNALKESIEGLVKNVWTVMLKPFCEKHDVIIKWKNKVALMFFKNAENTTENIKVETEILYKIDEILGVNLDIQNLYFIMCTVSENKVRGRYQDGFLTVYEN